MNTKNLSDFGRTALALDFQFQEFERLAGSLERLPIESDGGFDRARGLLQEVDLCGKKMETCMQEMTIALNDAQVHCQKSAEVIQARAELVRQRQIQNEQVLERFKILGDKVRTVIETMPQINSEETNLDPTLVTKLPEFSKSLSSLIHDAHDLMTEARTAKIRVVEKNADALRQRLQNAQDQLSSFS